MEHVPAECHRHHAITAPLLALRGSPPSFHVMIERDGSEVFRVEDLERVLENGEEYSYVTLEQAIEVGDELPEALEE
jgi:hypothetical protein